MIAHCLQIKKTEIEGYINLLTKKSLNVLLAWCYHQKSCIEILEISCQVHMKIRKTKEQPIKYNAEISIELHHKNANFWLNVTQLAGIQPCQNVWAA